MNGSLLTALCERLFERLSADSTAPRMRSLTQESAAVRRLDPGAVHVVETVIEPLIEPLVGPGAVHGGSGGGARTVSREQTVPGALPNGSANGSVNGSINGSAGQVLLVGAAFALALAVPNLSFVVGLVGSTGGIFLCTLLPCFFYRQVSGCLAALWQSLLSAAVLLPPQAPPLPMRV